MPFSRGTLKSENIVTVWWEFRKGGSSWAGPPGKILARRVALRLLKFGYRAMQQGLCGATLDWGVMPVDWTEVASS